MCNYDDRRKIDSSEPLIINYLAPFNGRDIAQWRNSIKTRPGWFGAGFSFGTGYMGKDMPPEPELDGSLYERFKWPISKIKKSWLMAWPEHEANPKAIVHSLPDVDDLDDDHRIELLCYKIKYGWIGSRYLIFASALYYDQNKQPFGWMAGASLTYALGAISLALIAEEPPYRQWILAKNNLISH